MSRRETFLESARAANDQALSATPARERGSAPSSDLVAILTSLAETSRRLEAVEQAIHAALLAKSDRVASKGARERTAVIAAWALAAALATLLGMTLLRPDWALRAQQRTELLLGQKLYQRLQHMEESDRLEVLRSLWPDPPLTID